MRMWLLVALMGASGAPAHAQESGAIAVGVHAAYNFNDLNETGFGGHALFSLSRAFDIYPSFTTYNVSTSLWFASGLLKWNPVAGRVRPYLAAGPYYSRSSNSFGSAHDVGLLGVVGIQGRIGRLQPRAEFRLLKDGAVSTDALVGLSVVLRD